MNERADAMIELVGLRGFAEHYPHELSGGMRQRVNIARALVMEPQLILLDEPFAALDAQTREFMQVELLKILARTRTTALFITHQINEAIFLAHRVVVFSARPAVIKNIIEVDLPATRTLVDEARASLPRARATHLALDRGGSGAHRHDDGGGLSDGCDESRASVFAPPRPGSATRNGCSARSRWRCSWRSGKRGGAAMGQPAVHLVAEQDRHRRATRCSPTAASSSTSR